MKGVGGLGNKRDEIAFAKEEALLGIVSECAKLIYGLGRLGHLESGSHPNDATEIGKGIVPPVLVMALVHMHPAWTDT